MALLSPYHPPLAAAATTVGLWLRLTFDAHELVVVDKLLAIGVVVPEQEADLCDCEVRRRERRARIAGELVLIVNTLAERRP